MASFEYLDKRHETLYEAMNWGARRYLDSGVFTIMRKGGGSRILHAGAAIETSKDELWKTYGDLTRRYVTYLKQYAHQWDHIAELDVDHLFGPEITWKTRKILHQIVGDKLLPVWHAQAGHTSWREMIATYPYVAMGSDSGISSKSKRPDMSHLERRTLINEAHEQGCLVHGMGDTREETFLQTGWDTSDSITWLSGSRFGQFAGQQYSFRDTKAQSPQATSKARGFEAWLREKGLDPETLQGTKTHVNKLIVPVLLLQERQERIRNARLGIAMAS